MIMFKVMLVPVRLLFGTAKVSAKAGYKTAKTGAVVGAKTVVGSAKMGYSAGRAVGYGRTAVFAAGVAVGVLVASPQARAGVSPSVPGSRHFDTLVMAGGSWKDVRAQT